MQVGLFQREQVQLRGRSTTTVLPGTLSDILIDLASLARLGKHVSFWVAAFMYGLVHLKSRTSNFGDALPPRCSLVLWVMSRSIWPRRVDLL